MPNWKKLIVSGSDAVLNSVNISNGATISGSVIISGNQQNTGSLSVSGSVTANQFNISDSAVGSPSIYSPNNLNLSASNAVVVTSSPLRVATFNDAQTGSISAQTGDIIFNSTRGTYTVYSGSSWFDLIQQGATASYSDTASIALSGDGVFSGSFSGSFEGDGSNLTGITVTQVATAEDNFTSVTSYTASHGFNTKNVFVNIYDNNDELLLPATLKTLSTSSVAFTFDTSTSGRVVIGKAGHIIQAENLLAYRTGLSGSTIYNVTHSLDVEFPLVQTYLASTKEQIIPSKIKSLSVNAVQVEFDTTFSGSIVVKK